MNFSDFITDHGKRVNKEHFIHLIQVSQIDGKISQSELELLHKQGKKIGLTDPEIDILIRSEDKHIDGLIDLLLKGIMNNQTEDSLLSDFKSLIFED
jgi:hypothetical protein